MESLFPGWLQTAVHPVDQISHPLLPRRSDPQAILLTAQPAKEFSIMAKRPIRESVYGSLLAKDIH